MPNMMPLKRVVVGLAVALLAAFGWLAAWLFIPLFYEIYIVHPREGGLGASSVGLDWPTLVVAMCGFVVGFYFTGRRARRGRMPAHK
jgi:hypothetical protein